MTFADLEFDKIIRTIESEIAFDYLPGAIHWADRNYRNAWSLAIDRFESALISGVNLKEEGEIYKKNILNLLEKYKAFKEIDSTKNFLSSLKY